MLLAAIIVAVIFLTSARILARQQANGRTPKGFAGAMEAMTLWVRQEVVLPNVGAHGEGYAPYLLTVFFFILAMNLLGLLPWGATATSNIAVTAALALVAFVVIEITGMRALGLQGLHEDDLLPAARAAGRNRGSLLKVLLLVVMTPIEIIGKLAKPFALAVRLFANMTSGHVLVLALLGLTFLFQSYFVGVGGLGAGHGGHAARAVRRVPAGIRVHPADRRVHRLDAGGALERREAGKRGSGGRTADSDAGRRALSPAVT